MTESRSTVGGSLTTHVLDTMSGRPAAGVAIELFRVEDARRRHLVSTTTNADGRCDAPLLDGDRLTAGVYELVFDVARYFIQAGVRLPERPFLDRVPIRFGIAAADQHHHVPLLISPCGYTTYRGS
jgi:5-hydroxyisourate hydrolase